MNRHLTEDELGRYQRDGVLFPIPVLTAEEVAFYRAAVEDLENRLGGRPKASEMSQPQLYFRWAYDLATHPAVLRVVEDVLGGDILVHSTSIFSKHPGTDDYVSWHQDGFYWELDTPLLTSAWIALTASTPENGCMRVVPGSHVERRLPHTEKRGAENNLLLSGLEVAVDVDERHARDVRLAAGELSLHNVDIVHGSKPNRSSGKRIGFAVRYVAPKVRQILQHHEVILARGRDGYGHYQHLTARPGPSFEESVRAQSEFAVRWRKVRFGN